MLMNLLIVFLLVLMIVAALFAVAKKDLLVAVLSTGAVSLILSLVFLILQAPDVALTEASIGAALSTVIFLVTLKKTRRKEEE